MHASSRKRDFRDTFFLRCIQFPWVSDSVASFRAHKTILPFPPCLVCPLFLLIILGAETIFVLSWDPFLSRQNVCLLIFVNQLMSMAWTSERASERSFVLTSIEGLLGAFALPSDHFYSPCEGTMSGQCNLTDEGTGVYRSWRNRVIQKKQSSKGTVKINHNYCLGYNHPALFFIAHNS